MQNTGKEAAAKAAADLIEPNMLVGLGSGTTASLFIQQLGTRCQSGLSIKAVASSRDSLVLAEAAGIPMVDMQPLTQLDLTVDGADEADPQKQLIKGGGGSLLREKIIAAMSKKMIVIIDSRKKVEYLGKFPLPIEILPFGYQATLQHLLDLGYQGKWRMNMGALYLTDNQNYIFDIHLPFPCKDPLKEDQRLRAIPGVIETGFFIGLASQIIIGKPDGSIETY